MLKIKQPWLQDLLLLTVFFLAFYLLWIGSYPLFTPDEGRYSEVAREMVATGDYITPKVDGVPFLDKPILYYWLQASAIKVFGLKEWSLRIWPTLLGILGIIATYLGGVALFNRRTGLLSAVILGLCPLYYGAAHYANLDLEVAVLLSCSLLCFITAALADSKQSATRSFLLAYIFSGLAALTKGLIAIVFPAMILGVWIALLNRWSLIRKMHLVLGLVIFLAITVPWYMSAQKANPEFFHFFFVVQQFQRFLTKADFNNKTAGWFYLPIVLAGLFPWSAFALQAIWQKCTAVFKNKQSHPAELFLLIWLIGIFMFFSIPKSKTIGYILPIFPALALLIGHYLNTLWDKSNTLGLRAGVLIFVLFSIGFTTFLVIPDLNDLIDIPLEATFNLHLSATIFLIASMLCYIFSYKGSFKPIFAFLSISSIIFLLTIINSAHILNVKTIKPLATQIKPLLKENDEIVAFFRYYQDLPIYLERRITITADWNAPDIEHYDNWQRELWYGMNYLDTTKWLINHETFRKRWNSKQRMYVFTEAKYYERLQQGLTNPVYKIAQHNDTILVSNQPAPL